MPLADEFRSIKIKPASRGALPSRSRRSLRPLALPLVPFGVTICNSRNTLSPGQFGLAPGRDRPAIFCGDLWPSVPRPVTEVKPTTGS